MEYLNPKDLLKMYGSVAGNYAFHQIEKLVKWAGQEKELNLALNSYRDAVVQKLMSPETIFVDREIVEVGDESIVYSLASETAKVFAHLFLAELKQNGVKNYISYRMDVKHEDSDDQIEVIVQNYNEECPSDRVSILNKEVEELQKELWNLRKNYDDLSKKYIDETILNKELEKRLEEYCGKVESPPEEDVDS